jgi:hypothetical protein
MIVAVLIFVSVAISLLGLYMVNKTGNYENMWGAFLYYGLGAAAMLSVIGLLLLLLGLV